MSPSVRDYSGSLSNFVRTRRWDVQERARFIDLEGDVVLSAQATGAGLTLECLLYRPRGWRRDDLVFVLIEDAPPEPRPPRPPDATGEWNEFGGPAALRLAPVEQVFVDAGAHGAARNAHGLGGADFAFVDGVP